MDIKKIKSLIDLLKNNDLSVLEICEADSKIRIEKKNCCETASAANVSGNDKQPVKQDIQVIRDDQNAVDFNNINEVRAPMVGVFYSAPSPESSPFVKIGDRVKKGDVLCIIEAMKLMNEICAETEGEIVDICAKNEQVIEYGQTLFKIF